MRIAKSTDGQRLKEKSEEKNGLDVVVAAKPFAEESFMPRSGAQKE